MFESAEVPREEEPSVQSRGPARRGKITPDFLSPVSHCQSPCPTILNIPDSLGDDRTFAGEQGTPPDEQHAVADAD
jgi:hypothetical protein